MENLKEASEIVSCFYKMNESGKQLHEVLPEIQKMIDGYKNNHKVLNAGEVENVEEKIITFNFDEAIDGEAAIFALYAGLRMYKELKDKQPREEGTFSIPAAEAYCMLEQIKEELPDDYMECMSEYDKIYY